MTRWYEKAIVAGLLLGTLPAFGQFTWIQDFEAPFSPPGDGLAEVIFREPSFSSSSVGLNPTIGSDAYMCSLATCGSFVVPHAGNQADVVYWGWLHSSYHTSWVRLSTSNAQWSPNPALHLGGKVKLWIGGTAYTDGTFGTEVSTGKLFLGLGIRETGAGTPLGANGGAAGSIEWVGLTEKLAEITGGTNGFCDTTIAAGSDDVQVRALGAAAGPDDVCVSAGTNGVLDTTAASDDTTMITPKGMYTVPLDRTMRQFTFDLPALEASGNVFSFSGDAALLATPNNRGTLEHLTLTNDPNNGTVNANVVLMWIDDVEFEAAVPNPPTIVLLPSPPLPLDTSVNLSDVDPTASLVELYIKGRGGDPDLLLGSVSNPGNSTVNIPTSIPLPFGADIYARQTVSAVQSDFSTPVKVSSPGNGPLRLSMAVRETDQYDHNLSCGGNGTGYNPDLPSNLEFIGATGMVEGAWGTPIGGQRRTPAFGWQQVTFNPCTDGVTAFSGNGEIATNGVPYTNGVWEGLYFRIDEFAPTAGPYTVYVDDVKVRVAGADYCLIDNFESYTIADYIVEGATAGTAATAAAGDDVQVVAVGGTTFVGQIIISAGPNGTIDTTPASGELIAPIRARFDTPGVAGTSQGVASTPVLSAVTDEESYSGSKSLKLRWAFVSASNANSHLRLTSNGSTSATPPETFLNPDPVIPFTLDGTWCDGSNDISYSYMMLMEPSPVMGDCDLDGDVDLADGACFQQCYGRSPLSPTCDSLFDYYGNDTVNDEDYQMFQLSITGPQ